MAIVTTNVFSIVSANSVTDLNQPYCYFWAVIIGSHQKKQTKKTKKKKTRSHSGREIIIVFVGTLYSIILVVVDFVPRPCPIF